MSKIQVTDTQTIDIDGTGDQLSASLIVNGDPNNMVSVGPDGINVYYPLLSDPNGLNGTPPTVLGPMIWIDDSANPACLMVWSCDTETYVSIDDLLAGGGSGGGATAAPGTFVPDLVATGNPNEFTVSFTWIDENGDPQSSTDPTPVTITHPDPVWEIDPDTGILTLGADGDPNQLVYSACNQSCPKLTGQFQIDAGSILDPACQIADEPAALAKIGDALSAAGYF